MKLNERKNENKKCQEDKNLRLYLRALKRRGMRQGKERNIKQDRESRQVAPVLAAHSSSSIPRGRAWHGLHAHITENVMLATTCERPIEHRGRKYKKVWASIDIWVQSDCLGLCVTENCTIPLQHKRRQRKIFEPRTQILLSLIQDYDGTASIFSEKFCQQKLWTKIIVQNRGTLMDQASAKHLRWVPGYLGTSKREFSTIALTQSPLKGINGHPSTLSTHS